ncbi:acetate--CoA ligase family protein [Roseovarius sp. SCSIO 43702]|uniref:acetate--CoA ligase family protein n=1 Tax=Roseovarius sp. SCSIO 43702 TaxID=2823043 RepID=UPI001C72BF1A|nr:acetate--CoA ligase family protein [Roseovarius sp. SCSIO 43702]QYX57878.1 acetate--CoA ligase family protein [Roseovarius sp. SCSIO 43702]
MRDLTRLFQPKSIAVIGGGFWCANVIEQCRKMGFDGPVWPVHPSRETVGGVAAHPSLDALPGVPDAVFVGVNRALTVEMVAELARMGAGGAVCFASGFREAQAETGDGESLQAALLEAAGDMPIVGPNCYGFINYLDGALLWPDQHGGVRQERGVAILTQSSNMAINMTMQARGLPLAYVATAGNQAQTGLSEIGAALLEDSRVTALGLHIEGVGDLRAFEALAARARSLGKPIVALKVGKSQQAQSAAVSHTASVAGSDAGARALLERLGIARVESLPALLETLKLLHFAGPLPTNRIVSLSCSGGEASLMADSALGRGIAFPPLSETQSEGLRAALGPKVALANPLDYHTYIWDDVDAMTRTFTAALRGDVAMGVVIADFPRTDRCSDHQWDCVIAATGAASRQAGRPVAVVASLPEGLSEEVAAKLVAEGVVPMQGLDDAITAIACAARLGEAREAAPPVLLPGEPEEPVTLSEAEAKAALARHGVTVARAEEATGAHAAAEAAARIGGRVVLKGAGVAHKTEAGLVALDLGPDEVEAAARAMGCERFLVEEMVTGAVAELLVGVVRDPAHGFVLTLGAGGTLTEILRDSVSLLLPVTETELRTALDRLRIAPVLSGYRGKPGADMAAIVDEVLAVQSYVEAHREMLEEVEINPLMVTPDKAVAADALIRVGR